MTDELDVRATEITRGLDEVDDLLKSIHQLPAGPERVNLCHDIDDRVKAVDHHIKLFDTDRAGVAAAKKAQYKMLSFEYRKRFKDLKQELQWLRQEDIKANLVDGHSPMYRDINDMNPEEARKYGSNLQSETVDMADETIRIMEEAKDTAANAATQMKGQTEQMGRIKDDLDEIDDALTSSTRVLRDMLKRALTDKYIWVLVVLVIIALILFIIFKLTNSYTEEPDINNP